METISDNIFAQYGEIANQEGIYLIPEPERTLIAVYTAQGLISNGGFAYFFELDFKGNECYEIIIESYKNIGLNKHAEAIESVLALFPGRKPHKATKEREEFIYKYMSGDDEVNYSDVVEKAERILFSDTDTVYKLADNYATKNV
ncbi:MAG: DMP19 family protein [Candidatus Pacearchaeota archaeon]|nr:DMP19 family protein [Candidatus Pacearchaeota archaeon]